MNERRRRTDTDYYRDAPWYARFTVQVGVPAAIALGLVVFLTWIVRDSLRTISAGEATILAIEQAQTATAALIVGNQERIIALLADHERQQDQMQAIMLALCLNQSDEAGGPRSTARDRCLAYAAAARGSPK